MRVYRISDTEANLCDTCPLSMLECPKATVLEFGNGVGNDNIVACSEYLGSIGGKIAVDKSYGIVQAAEKQESPKTIYNKHMDTIHQKAELCHVSTWLKCFS